MIHIRDEGETVKTGFNFYPKAYDYVGMVIEIVYDGYTSWVTQVLIVL